MNNNDINKKLNRILGGLAGTAAERAKINAVLNSSEAERIKAKLSEADKQKIIDRFNSASADEIRSKLSGADLSKVSAMSAEDIVKMIKKL